jgi:hypothetical protein
LTCFRVASEHVGNHVEFEYNMALAPMIERRMDIVLAMQDELKTQVLGAKRPRPLEGEEQHRAARVARPTHASTSTTGQAN